MPYKLIKVKGKNLYKVINELTGKVHSKGSTLSDAEKQIRLMEFFDNTTRKNKKWVMRFYFHKKSAPNSSPFKSYEGLKIRHFLAIWPFLGLGLGLGFATDFSQRIFQPFFSHFWAIF